MLCAVEDEAAHRCAAVTQCLAKHLAEQEET